ncbi:MAG: hypothetical protein QM503_00040 [Bacteroidota bacterium]
MIYRIQLIVIVFFITSTVFAQSQIKMELQQIRNNFIKKDQLSMVVNYDMYANDTSQVIIESQQTKIHRQGNNQIVDFMGTPTCYTDEYTISIYKSEKKVVLGDAIVGFENMILPDITLDSLVNIFDIDKVVSETPPAITYHIQIPNTIISPYRAIEIKVNDDNLYEKIILRCRYPLNYYGKCSDCENDIPRVELTFDYSVNQNELLSELNELLSCIEENDNQYYLSGVYSQYKIINLKKVH